MIKITKVLSVYLITLFLIGCSNNQSQIKPSWINSPNSNIGVCGFIPSENFAKQKNIALKKAINSLMIKKGYASGTIDVKSTSTHTQINTQESLNKQFIQDSIIKFTFENIKYNIKITDIYKDEDTKEVYVRIEEI
ncbi:MAG: hypothetical protein U9N59_07265 [Campylobacterota bacterium]|nr:hypothetical protein [Campylobacterota bacterium]